MQITLIHATAQDLTAVIDPVCKLLQSRNYYAGLSDVSSAS